MIQLIYTSTARPGLSAGDFEQILASARANNRAADLTSLLVYDGARFLQVIEGGDGEIERCFRRLSFDQRHTMIEIKALKKVDRPDFGGWDLQFHRLDGNSSSAIGAIQAIAHRVFDRDAAALLEGFCGLSRRAAA